MVGLINRTPDSNSTLFFILSSFIHLRSQASKPSFQKVSPSIHQHLLQRSSQLLIVGSLHAFAPPHLLDSPQPPQKHALTTFQSARNQPYIPKVKQTNLPKCLHQTQDVNPQSPSASLAASNKMLHQVAKALTTRSQTRNRARPILMYVTATDIDHSRFWKWHFT